MQSELPQLSVNTTAKEKLTGMPTTHGAKRTTKNAKPSGSPIRLIHGCALQTLAAMPDNSVDLIVTDPPYKVISGGNKSEWKSGYKTSVLHANDGKIFKHNAIKAEDWFAELYRVLKPGCHAYIMTNNLNLREYLNLAHAVGFKFHNLLRWDKNNKNANRWYMKDCEYTLFLYKPPAKTINNPGSAQGFAVPNPRNKRHPTEKPVKLFQHYIENSTKPGELVLDPFMGCGTAAIATIKSKVKNLRFIGIEIDPDYYQIAQRRVEKAQKRITTLGRRRTLTTPNRE